MLARPNARFNLTRDQEVVRFNELDAERLQQEAARLRTDGALGGGMPAVNVRLLTDTELPVWLEKAELMAKQKEEAAEVCVAHPRAPASGHAPATCPHVGGHGLTR